MLKVVIIGNGMVGHHYVEQLAASPVTAKITVIGGEAPVSYTHLRAHET